MKLIVGVSGLIGLWRLLKKIAESPNLQGLNFNKIKANHPPSIMKKVCQLMIASLVIPILFSAESRGYNSPVTNPVEIQTLTYQAYLWGLAPEFSLRESTYLTLLTGPYNSLKYSPVPAAWNNAAENAGDSSVLYVSGWINFASSPELVLTVPPSKDHYYISALYDCYLNVYGSIGTRTTPSDSPASFLLVGPKSRYAKYHSVKIKNFVFKVLASDTDLNWFITRVVCNSLAPAYDPQSVPSTYSGYVRQFALNTLSDFQGNGNRPVFPVKDAYTPSASDIMKASSFRNTPIDVVAFFQQVGSTIQSNKFPSSACGLSGTPLSLLPSYVVPQAYATHKYEVPSLGLQSVLGSLRPLGLSENGFSVPNNWGANQLSAFQKGYVTAQAQLKELISRRKASSNTEFWTILNSGVGTYPSNSGGLLIKDAVILAGGVANVPLDAVYPIVSQDSDGNVLDGNNTYTITFMPPSNTATFPEADIIPPLVTNGSGNPLGFWSVSLYQRDSSDALSPYISQASVLNLHYSTTSDAVLSIDTNSNTMTVIAPSWGNLAPSTPLIFGQEASRYGLQTNTIYYVATNLVMSTNGGMTNYTFSISDQWIQDLSSNITADSTNLVPIQNSGVNGALVALSNPSIPISLTYGPVQPVSQLGSAQITAGQLATNVDGSITIWFAPTLPTNCPSAANWIPTPSSGYIRDIYDTSNISTTFQIYMRMYYPTPGSNPPSILPPTPIATNINAVNESYLPPPVIRQN